MRFVRKKYAAPVFEANNLFLNSAILQWKYFNAFEIFQTSENHLFSYFIAHFNLRSLMFYINKQHFVSKYIVSKQNCAVNVKSTQRIDEIELCFLNN